MRAAYTEILFILCLNIAAFMLNASGTFPISSELWINPTDITNTFNITIFAGIALGGTLMGVIAVLLRQGVYATYALIIWIIGILLPVGQWVLGGVPIMLAYILPSELWFVSSAVQAFFMLSFFWFFIELAAQRQLT